MEDGKDKIEDENPMEGHSIDIEVEQDDNPLEGKDITKKSEKDEKEKKSDGDILKDVAVGAVTSIPKFVMKSFPAIMKALGTLL